MYSPSSPPHTGPTLKNPDWGSGFDAWLAWGWRIMDVTPAGSAALIKRKVTGFLLWPDWDWDRDWRVGTEQLKDNISPRFTTPVEGFTDNTGGGKEGMERVGAAAREVQKGRGKWNNYLYVIIFTYCIRWQKSCKTSDNANNIGFPQLLAKPPSLTVNTGTQYTLCLMFLWVCVCVCGF